MNLINGVNGVRHVLQRVISIWGSLEDHLLGVLFSFVNKRKKKKKKQRNKKPIPTTKMHTRFPYIKSPKQTSHPWEVAPASAPRPLQRSAMQKPLLSNLVKRFYWKIFGKQLVVFRAFFGVPFFVGPCFLFLFGCAISPPFFKNNNFPNFKKKNIQKHTKKKEQN